MLIAILVFGLVIVLFALNAGNRAKGPARKLHAKVAELDDVTQHDYESIIEKLGPPNAVRAMPGGTRFVQWIRPGYHIAMSFGQDGKCLGIDSEVAA